ncbi:hypothetical protein J1614_001127 [Plenodomus biglobosus]|nr:hypothetical protein J1614_001127 [Plenodomus biglobosus]
MGVRDLMRLFGNLEEDAEGRPFIMAENPDQRGGFRADVDDEGYADELGSWMSLMVWMMAGGSQWVYGSCMVAAIRARCMANQTWDDREIPTRHNQQAGEPQSCRSQPNATPVSSECYRATVPWDTMLSALLRALNDARCFALAAD